MAGHDEAPGAGRVGPPGPEERAGFAEEARRFEAWLTQHGLADTSACLARELARRQIERTPAEATAASGKACATDGSIFCPSAAEGRLNSLLCRFARGDKKQTIHASTTASGVGATAVAAAASAPANRAAEVSEQAAVVRKQVAASLRLGAADALAADRMFTTGLVAARHPWRNLTDIIPGSYDGADDEWELGDVGYREEVAEHLVTWSSQQTQTSHPPSSENHVSPASPESGSEHDTVESMDLRIVYRQRHTGFEPHQDFPIISGEVVAGRYTILKPLGTASFCTAVHARDIDTGTDVCLKIIKNSKDNFDQALDEIKLLKLVNSGQDTEASHILRFFDYFYFKEHMFLVTELGGANLFDHSTRMVEEGHRAWWTIERLQRVAYQITDALVYIHSLALIHSDLKPENIVIKSLSPLHIRVIDFGSSCFIHDHLGVYVQSRSYRAPEVVIAAPYDYRIDNWSLGTILAELATGTVLFENENVPTMLARIAAIMGPFQAGFLASGKETQKYFTDRTDVYMRVNGTPDDAPPTPINSVILRPVPSSLAARLGTEYASDTRFLHFLSSILKVDPAERYTSEQMLAHPWLDGQKELHSRQMIASTPDSTPGDDLSTFNVDTSVLDVHNEPDEGDPDETVQTASEDQLATSAAVATQPGTNDYMILAEAQGQTD